MGGKKMDVLDLIKEAFYYPINDYKNWLIIAILFLLNTVLSSYVISKGGAVGIIGSIISLYKILQTQTKGLQYYI